MKRLALPPLLVPLVLLVSGGLLGLAVSYDPRIGFSSLAALISASLPAMLLAHPRTPAALRHGAAMLIVAVASLMALYVITQYRHLGFEPKFALITRLGTLLSAPFPSLLPFSPQQNAAATFIGPALPLALGLALGTRPRWLWLITALGLGLGLLLTGSRGAWAAQAAVLLPGSAYLLAGLHHAERPRRLLLYTLGAAGLLALAALLLALLPAFEALRSAAYSRAISRLTLYENSLLLALDTPLTGIGPGTTFGLVYSYYALGIRYVYLTYPHNLFLAVWLGQGLLGLLGLCWLTLSMLRSAWRAGAHYAGPLWLGAALGALAPLLHGLVDSAPFSDAWWSMPIILATIGLALGEAAHAAPQQAAPAAFNWRIPAGLALVFLLLGVVWLALPAGRAVLIAQQAALTQARADLAPDLSEPQRSQLRATAEAQFWDALRLDPAQPTALRRLGQILAGRGEDTEAIALLEQALQQQPGQQAARKQLGYSLLWLGRVEDGISQLNQVERRSEVVSELDAWSNYWNSQNAPERAAAATRAATALR